MKHELFKILKGCRFAYGSFGFTHLFSDHDYRARTSTNYDFKPGKRNRDSEKRDWIEIS